MAAAVLDYALADGTCDPVAARLRTRRIPFVIYSGYSELRTSWSDVPFVSKPASAETLVGLLRTQLGAGEMCRSAPD